jgi:WD40 repeat protein
VQVVNIQSGRVVASLAGHDDDTSVEAVAFSRHLPHVAMSAGMDGKLVLWDLAAAVASTRATCEHPNVRIMAHAALTCFRPSRAGSAAHVQPVRTAFACL